MIQQSSSFLHLPYEIRFEIYSYLPPTVEDGRYYSHPSHYSSNCLLETCRQIHQEALGVFRQELLLPSREYPIANIQDQFQILNSRSGDEHRRASLPFLTSLTIPVHIMAVVKHLGLPLLTFDQIFKPHARQTPNRARTGYLARNASDLLRIHEVLQFSSAFTRLRKVTLTCNDHDDSGHTALNIVECHISYLGDNILSR